MPPSRATLGTSLASGRMLLRLVYKLFLSGVLRRTPPRQRPAWLHELLILAGAGTDPERTAAKPTDAASSGAGERTPFAQPDDPCVPFSCHSWLLGWSWTGGSHVFCLRYVFVRCRKWRDMMEKWTLAECLGSLPDLDTDAALAVLHAPPSERPFRIARLATDTKMPHSVGQHLLDVPFDRCVFYPCLFHCDCPRRMVCCCGLPWSRICCTGRRHWRKLRAVQRSQ